LTKYKQKKGAVALYRCSNLSILLETFRKQKPETDFAISSAISIFFKAMVLKMSSEITLTGDKGKLS